MASACSPRVYMGSLQKCKCNLLMSALWQTYMPCRVSSSHHGSSCSSPSGFYCLRYLLFMTGELRELRCEEISCLYVSGFYLLLWTIYYSYRALDDQQGTGVCCPDFFLSFCPAVSSGPIQPPGEFFECDLLLRSLLEVPFACRIPKYLCPSLVSTKFPCGTLTPSFLTILACPYH